MTFYKSKPAEGVRMPENGFQEGISKGSPVDELRRLLLIMAAG
jgi:hypothetical protein